MKDFIKLLIYFKEYIFNHSIGSKIIYYHDVGLKYTDMGTEPDLLLKHFDIVLDSGFEFVNEIKEPNHQIMVCFDDGWKGLYDNKEMFLDRGIFPTTFIATDLIGKDGYMTIDQIRELQTLGFIFQAHTCSHTGLPDHHGLDLRHELYDCKSKLEYLFKTKFTGICFPQGRYSDEVISECKRSGYTKLYSSIAGCYYDLCKEGLICRNLCQSLTPIMFKFMLQGKSSYFKNRYKSLQYEK